MGCTIRYVSPKSFYENLMIDKKTVWAITHPTSERVYVVRNNFEINTADDSKTITVSGDLVWVIADTYRLFDEIQVEELRIRKAYPSEIKVFAEAEAELRLKKLLDAGGIIVETFLEKGIPDEVKKIIQQATELASHVQAKLTSELGKLVKKWSGDK